MVATAKMEGNARKATAAMIQPRPAAEAAQQAEGYRRGALRKIDDLQAGLAILRQSIQSGDLSRRAGADDEDVYSAVHCATQDLEPLIAEAAISTRQARRPRRRGRRYPPAVARLVARAQVIQAFAGGVLDSVAGDRSVRLLPEMIQDIDQHLAPAEDAMGRALEAAGTAARACGGRS
jgi:hypothetical protein